MCLKLMVTDDMKSNHQFTTCVVLFKGASYMAHFAQLCLDFIPSMAITKHTHTDTSYWDPALNVKPRS